MNWAKFIKEIASQKLLSSKNRLTFIATFGDCNEALHQDQKTTEGHLREIYKCFEKECPKLQTIKKGKKEVLREYLQDLFNNPKVDLKISGERPSTPINHETITPSTTSTSFNLLGRDADRQKLIELSQKHKLVLLKASAGIGKSTLARHFLETQFVKVIRLEMGLESGNVTPAEEKVSQILRKEFDEEPSRDFQTNLEILREKLSDKSRPIGVLIDNLEPALDENYRFQEKLRGYDALLAVLGDPEVCSFTLITSRRSLITPRARLHEYSLEGLDITAWRQYFYDCENGADSEALVRMCIANNGNAKVMQVLHSMITRNFDRNIETYWNRWQLNLNNVTTDYLEQQEDERKKFFTI